MKWQAAVVVLYTLQLWAGHGPRNTRRISGAGQGCLRVRVRLVCIVIMEFMGSCFI